MGHPKKSLNNLCSNSKNFNHFNEKAKCYKQIKDLIEMGLEAKDNRVLEPMEIDYAIINVVNKIDQLEGLSNS